jgi:catechol 2,3-dioxygenase-like lactoylglutathione lyase family enzyme
VTVPVRIRRVVPDLHVDPERVDAARAFYTGVLGLELVMDLGWILNFGSASDETAQLHLMTAEATAPGMPDVSVESDDIVEVWRRAQAETHEIIYPLTDETWGVRRFFVRDPSGHVINVMTHLPG